MYDRFLLVGLGGSGGSTLGHLKKEIQRWLRESNLDDKVPAAWQFIHIDTPTTSDASPRLSQDEYVGLITPGVQFRAVQALLDSNRSLFEELQTWRVEPTALTVPLERGAGQFRALGRTVAMAYAARIRGKNERGGTEGGRRGPSRGRGERTRRALPQGEWRTSW